jgi:hypothetical protein
MPDLRIAQPDAQALLDYLKRLPWQEVNPFVVLLINLKPIEEAAPEAPKEVKGEPV